MILVMSDQNDLITQWDEVVAGLPTALDLEVSARNCGLFSRVRAVRSAADLLRLALVYGFCGFSLRQTAAWAEAQGVASFSAPGLMKQFRRASTWMKHLLGELLAERSQSPRLPGAFRLKLIDATCLSHPGSKGTNWRLHLGFDPVAMAISHVLVTDAGTGETLSRHPIDPGDLLVCDAGYAKRPGLWAAHDAGGGFIVRLNWQNVPLLHTNGTPFDLLAALRCLSDTEIGDVSVLVGDDPTARGRQLPARLIAVRKAPEAAEKARHKIRKECRRKKRKPDPRTLEAAGYMFVLTSVNADQMPAVAVLETYRFRWQVELSFKRLKSLLHLDDLPAKEPDLAQTFICAKIIAAILLDRLAERSRDFSPWGRTLPVAAPFHVAHSASLGRSAPGRHTGRARVLQLATADCR